MSVSRATPAVDVTVLAPRFQNKSPKNDWRRHYGVYIEAYYYERLAPTLFSYSLNDWGLPLSTALNIFFTLLSSRPSQPLLDRSIPDFNTFSSVEDWLAAIKMSQYRDNFLNSGFTSLQLVAQMTSEWVPLLIIDEELWAHMALDGHTCVKLLRIKCVYFWHKRAQWLSLWVTASKWSLCG